MTPRRVLIAWFVAMLAVYAIVGAWQPLQSDDWTQLTWSMENTGSWLGAHYALSDFAGYALARWVALHAVVSALASAALVLGVFVIAMRRLPRDTWADTLGVIAGSALLWIGQPRAGLVWFHRPHVAAQVIGCALAVWTVAPLRCGWRVRGAVVPPLVVAALLVGTSTRQIAVATLVGFALGMRRVPARARWMWAVLGGLIVGAIAGFADAPYITAKRVFGRSLDSNLLALNLPIRETGQLVSLVLLLVVAKLAIDALWPAPALAAPTAGSAAPIPIAPSVGEPAGLPAPRETLAWFIGWFGISVTCLFGPRYSEATLLPATLVLVIATLPYLGWLCTTPALRLAITATAGVLHAVVWVTALLVFARLGGEFRDRMARLAHTPPGESAVITPYSDEAPTDWFLGEDWALPARQLIGIDLFGVRDIAFDSRFSSLEDNPGLAIRFEADALDPAQQAVVPRLWATEITGARQQFETFVERATGASRAVLTARLRVDNLPFAERRGRPLEVSAFRRGRLTSPAVSHTQVDADDRQRVVVPGAIASQYPEAYVVQLGHAHAVAYDGTAYKVQSLVASLIAVVACDPERCLLLDAFRPRI